MLTKTIKLTLEYSTLNSLSEKKFNYEIKEIQHNLFKACNTSINYLYQNDIQNILRKDLDLPSLKDKDVYDKSFSSFIENKLNEYVPGALSNNLAQTRQFLINRYNQDKKNGLLKGNVTLSRFKKNLPLIIHNKSYSIINNSQGLLLDIRFFNLKKKKELNIESIFFKIPKLNKNEKSTILKIINTEYKQGSAQFIFNNKINKWQILVSFSHEPIKKDVNSNIIMGIDLGISNVACFSIFNTETNSYQPIPFTERCISGNELIKLRQKIHNRIKSASISSKWSSYNNSTRGKKARISLSSIINKKYSNFRETYNHKISRYIIKEAIKYNAGIIQMENLSGFSDKHKNSLMKNWSYFDLQTKIKYKAEECGIKTIFIDPKYTSQRCNCCGYINKKNRINRKFHCIRCGYRDNADVNSSKNLSLPNIEDLIRLSNEQPNPII